MARIGDMAMLPNGAGVLGRVVGVQPLAGGKNGLASVQYAAQVDSRAIPPGARAVGVPLAGSQGSGAARGDTLVGAQQQADAVRTPDDMSVQERGQLQQMQARDAAVRQEEETHAAMAGPYAGAPQYELQQGPDGRQYVVNGAVPIRFTSAATGDQAATEQAMRAIRASAQSPTAPSTADMQVFQQASQTSHASLRHYHAAEQAGQPAQRPALMAQV